MSIIFPKNIDYKTYQYNEMPAGQAFVIEKGQNLPEENIKIYLKTTEERMSIDLKTGLISGFPGNKNVWPVTLEIGKVKFK